MFARRRQVQPDVIRSLEGAPTPTKRSENPRLRTIRKRRGSRTTKTPFEPDCCALLSSSKPPRAAARKIPTIEGDCDVLQIARMFEGARSIQAEPPKTPQPVVKPQCRKQPGEKNEILLSV